MSNKSGVSSQVISLPSGGGALTGLGETFAADLFTGTGNFSVPIAVPPGRNGFGPSLRLAYSSGAGNGPFGMGWSLAVPGIARRTARGVPTYDDARDVFVLSGAEELVEVGGTRPGRTRYRPRVEGPFAVVERLLDDDDDIWEVRSTDGLVSTYGTPGRRGADSSVTLGPDVAGSAPAILAWRLTATRDPFGNRIVYRYRSDAEPAPGHRPRQPLLQRIEYVDDVDQGRERFLVSVSLVYDDEEYAGPRAPRPDPFLDCRAGVELRTARRCTWIVVRATTDAERLVCAYRLDYLDERDDLPDRDERLPPNGVSLLSRVQLVDYDDTEQPHEELPPLEFGYTAFRPGAQRFSRVRGDNLPVGSLARSGFELADLTGDGLPDIVEIDGTVRWWQNLGEGRFAAPRAMTDAPAGLGLADAGVQLIDADGDGRIDLLLNTELTSGFFPLSRDARWDRRSFRPYRQAPTFSLEDPEVRLLDLDGDGVPDALRAGSRLECYFNDPATGWGETRRVERRALADFPDVTFTDPRVRLADMTGDGAQDIVLIHGRSVQYWPNVGRGTWGARTVMAAAPRLPDGYEPRRLVLGDVDGDGAADLLYVEDGRVTLWINRCGNGWSPPVVITGTPPVADADAVRLVDLLGSGVSGLLWSRDADGTRPTMWFLDLCGARKPYLLDRIDNHLGAVTTVRYASSTRAAGEDGVRLGGRRSSVLPFPVQVVADVAVHDGISAGTLTTEHRYRYGHWDGAEREFRGFGLVETLDRRTTTGASGAVPGASPPTLTRTWFHQGPVGERAGEWSAREVEPELWTGDPPPAAGDDAVARFLAALPDRRARRDALRALRGMTLRTELYALDGGALADRPYVVTESRYGLREESPPSAGSRRARVFFPHLVRRRTTRWERGTDPLTRLVYVQDYDDWGQPRRRTEIACPRGWDRDVEARSRGHLASRTSTAFATPFAAGSHLRNRASSTTTWEYRPGAGPGLSVSELARAPDDSLQLAVVAQALTWYDGDPARPDAAAFEGLALGVVGAYGAPVRTASLVLTDDLLTAAYGATPPPYLVADPPAWTAGHPAGFRQLAALAGYVRLERPDGTPVSGLYAFTERRRYDFHDDAQLRGRGMVLVLRDPLGRDTVIRYDSRIPLPASVTNPVGLATTATYDPRALAVRSVTDPNGNQTEVRYTPHRLLSQLWVRGRASASEGDRQRASTVVEHDLRAFERGHRRSPPVVAPIFTRTVRRVHHDTDAGVPQAERDAVIETREYYDGVGRLVQRRSQAEDLVFAGPGGNRSRGDGVLPPAQPDRGGDVTGTAATSPDRPWVVVSGWQVYDDKGRVAERHEPLLAQGWDFTEPTEAQLKARTRVTSSYDPVGRPTRTVLPDGSEQCMVYGVPADLGDPASAAPTPWEVFAYDPSDNAARTHPTAGPGVLAHRDTPTSTVLDALGRTVETVERNGRAAADAYRTGHAYDLHGRLLRTVDALGRQASRRVHDLAGRPLLTEDIDAGRRWAVFDAAGSLIESRDERGAMRLAAYDALGRPARIWARDEAAGPTRLREELTYGDGGSVAQSAQERAANAASNRLGRLVRHRDEAGQLVIDAYDHSGKVLRRSRAVIADRPVLAAVTAAVPGPFAVDWDAPPALDAPLELAFAYDALDRLTALLLPADVETAATGVRRTLRPRYTRSGLLAAVDLDGQTFVARIAYDARGRRTLVAYGNGVVTRSAVDAATGRLLRLRTERFTAPDATTIRPSGAVLQDLAYDDDLAGNTLRMADRTPDCGLPGTPDELDRTFTYDALHRLRSATGRECLAPQASPWAAGPRCGQLAAVRAYTHAYDVDAVGNLLAISATPGPGTRFDLVADAASNRLRAAVRGPDTHAYTYDANGNLTAEAGTRRFHWDHADRLVAFTEDPSDPGATPVRASYLYGADGQRVKKVVDRGGQVEAVTYLDGVFEHRVRSGVAQDVVHVQDGRARVATVRIGPALPGDAAAAAPVQYLLPDHLGSAGVVVGGATAQDDAVISREEHYPYGATSFGSHAGKRERFTGAERDGESGLGYHGRRYYAPWLGRWTSVDPVATDGPNGYWYGRGNPVRFRDPTGAWAEEGHYYTVYYVALAAGFPPKHAFNAAFFSALPDEVKPLEALPAGKRWLNPYPHGDLFGGSSAVSRRDIAVTQGGGHALTGGSSAVERDFRFRQSAAPSAMSLKFGFSLHAFGDAYSHEVLGGTTMYGPPFGHLPAGTAPDQVAGRTAQYEAYVQDLYRLMRKQAEGLRWAPVRSEADVVKSAGAISAVPDTAGQIAAIRRLAAGMGTPLSPYAPEHTASASREDFAANLTLSAQEQNWLAFDLTSKQDLDTVIGAARGYFAEWFKARQQEPDLSGGGP